MPKKDDMDKKRQLIYNQFMNKNFRNAIIILIIGVSLYLVVVGILAYIFHQSRWGLGSIELIILIWVPVVLSQFVLGFLITGLIALYKFLKTKKLMFSLIAVGVFVLPIAMLGIYQDIDQRIYEATYSFSVEKWAAADEDDRARIIRFFREEYNLVGENIDVVPPLLGTPDTVTETGYYYNLGNVEYVLGIDPLYYLVEFNDQNIIIAEGVYQG